MIDTKQRCYDVLIIGGGPAGTGLLLKALKDGTRNHFFDQRVALVEQSPRLIAGSITQYQVNSDTFSNVFLECLEGEVSSFIHTEKIRNEIALVRSYNGKSIPLPKLEGYFKKLGDLLQDALVKAQKCEFFMNTAVDKVVQQEDGTYTVHLSGKQEHITTSQIVLATGGVPKTLAGGNESFDTNISLAPHGDKIVHSDSILKSGLDDGLKQKLQQSPKVVILGGSHSAFSVAHYLLNGADAIPFRDGDIQIWSATRPKIYFNTRDEALASGYDDFGPDDFCPVTGKLYRLAGLRMDGRELYMQMCGVGQSQSEKRAVHHLYTHQSQELEEQLRSASLIVAAYGYTLNNVPFFNARGEKIYFKGEKDNHWVNDNCALLDNNEQVVPNVFATGLATGFIPRGELGGESSFMGQTNGIWYYQNAIADLIMRNLVV